jgi:hypothetical protein
MDFLPPSSGYKTKQHINIIREMGKDGKVKSEPMGAVCILVDSNVSDGLSASIFRAED